MGAGRADDGRMWRAIGAVLCSSFVGHGLGRFAYTPLVPLLITEGWFDAGAVGALGAANLAGYLVGALAARPLAGRLPLGPLLRTMMLIVAASFFACATPGAFLWFFFWRLMAGLAGGVLMVLAAPAILVEVPAKRRGLAMGAVFTGVGLGITASGTIVPLLLRAGLTTTWLVLGGSALLLSLLAWTGLPDHRPPARVTRGAGRSAAASAATPGLRLLLASLAVCYALDAVGLVPHMIFLVDYLARDVGFGAESGSLFWILYGIGAMVGPILFGLVADRIGFKAMLRLAFLIQAGCVLLILVQNSLAALMLSTLVIGGFTPGIASIVLGRIQELVSDPDARGRAWSLATTAFAIGQAAAAYGFSWIFGASGGAGPLLFVLAAAALLLAFVIELAAARAARPV